MNDTLTKTHRNTSTLRAVRSILLAIFILGTLGTGTELLLIEHTESKWQWVPLILIVLSLVVLVCHAAFRRAATVRVLQVTMILFIISGCAGILLHYQGKVAFKLETNPALGGMELFWEAIKGATIPPVLAPGMMIHMGLLGLAYTYRHPALAASTEKTDTPT